MKYSFLTSKIIKCALEVHTVLGPGLFEKVYEGCFEYEISEAGLFVERQLEKHIDYKRLRFDEGYRIDLLVEKKVVVEIKAVSALTETHFAQILTYMKLGGYPVGLLINFNVKSLRDGIRRVVL